MDNIDGGEKIINKLDVNSPRRRTRDDDAECHNTDKTTLTRAERWTKLVQRPDEMIYKLA